MLQKTQPSEQPSVLNETGFGELGRESSGARTIYTRSEDRRRQKSRPVPRHSFISDAVFNSQGTRVVAGGENTSLYPGSAFHSTIEKRGAATSSEEER